MPHRPAFFRRLSVLLFLAILISPAASSSARLASAQSAAAAQTSRPLDDILEYISTGWDRLTRSLSNCKTYIDPKTAARSVLYLPTDLPNPPEIGEVAKRCMVPVEHLPERITSPGTVDLSRIRTPGLLYLDHPYVVPGGQFNEMYGWDSYFIIRGLLRDHRNALAKGMVENFFFEIRYYGGVLNANRTYYLTRSQPPLLTSMILDVYEAERRDGQADLQWLRRAYPYAVESYRQWNAPAHLAGGTGLSRYFGYGKGPVPEVAADPGKYYRGVAHFFLLHDGADGPYLFHVDKAHPAASLVAPLFPALVCDPGTTPDAGHCVTDQLALSADYYKGDRSMRESGFDVSFRFGPYGAQTHHYAPVGLNSLLYKTEKDLEKISTLIGRQGDAKQWQKKTLERRKRIQKYLWNSRRGLFFDYNFKTRAQSTYEYATTFYPLWAGLASKKQARAVVRNLGSFEKAGGLVMSLRETGAQWDYPYGWAPVQLLAVQGLRRYGYSADADRIAYKFLTTVLQNFQRDHTIREKYDVVAKSSETHIEAGYKQNVIGFGWTNGVFLELLHELPPELRSQLANQ